MDRFVPTPAEVTTCLALRGLTPEQQRLFMETIQALASKYPKQTKIARLANVFEFKRPA